MTVADRYLGQSRASRSEDGLPAPQIAYFQQPDGDHAHNNGGRHPAGVARRWQPGLQMAVAGIGGEDIDQQASLGIGRRLAAVGADRGRR